MLSCRAVMPRGHAGENQYVKPLEKNPVGVQAITTVAYCQPCCRISQLEWVPKVVTIRALVDNPTGIFQVSYSFWASLGNAQW